MSIHADEKDFVKASDALGVLFENEMIDASVGINWCETNFQGRKLSKGSQ